MSVGGRWACHTMAAMAYDQDLADRIRELVAGEANLTEMKMYGGLAFLIGGNMAVAASGQGGIQGVQGICAPFIRGRQMIEDEINNLWIPGVYRHRQCGATVFQRKDKIRNRRQKNLHCGRFSSRARAAVPAACGRAGQRGAAGGGDGNGLPGADRVGGRPHPPVVAGAGTWGIPVLARPRLRHRRGDRRADRRGRSASARP